MKGVAASVVLLAAGACLAQPPRTRVQDCTTAGCHAKEVEHKYLHGPAAVGACDMCHQYKDVEAHKFELKRVGRDLCITCHINKAGTEGPVVHEPVAKGDCLGCHNPHGSEIKQMLQKPSVAAQCLSCHTEVLKGAHVHGPAGSDCTACHGSHAAAHPKLLVKEPRALCVSCHQDVGKVAGGSKFPHKPAEGDCLQCHAPHASDQVKALKVPPLELCGSCHQDVLKTAAQSTHPHSAVKEGKACLNCHSAHGSEHAKQMARGTTAACLECHAKAIVVSKEKTVPAVAELGKPEYHKHGPAALDDCSGCHGVHGGAEVNLLHTPYPVGFYQPFSDEAYALCFKCHDRALVTAKSAEKETGFRDGLRNLHSVHVMGSPHGRSCRACHSVHASRFEQQLADTVKYGEWSLPINFKPTVTGGSCSPGCHKPMGYDRGASTSDSRVPK